MYSHTFLRACALATMLQVAGIHASAQGGAPVSGRIVNSLSGDPLPGATLQIDELRQTATSGADGTYTFANVPPGTYQMSVIAPGYLPFRTTLVVGATAVTSDLRIDPELHFSEITSVSPEGGNQFEAFQATNVLSGQVLTKELQGTLGATLENQP